MWKRKEIQVLLFPKLSTQHSEFSTMSFTAERQRAYRLRHAQLRGMYAKADYERSRSQIAADIERARAKATFPKRENQNQN
jgi:hypothetical protein